MQSHSSYKKLLLGIFAVSAGLLVLNRYTAVYINETAMHFLLLFLATASLLLLITVYLFNLRSTKAVIAICILALLSSWARAFFFWGGDWETETVLYEMRKRPSVTIEYQLRGDKFAFGYKEQVVRRTRLIPYFDIINHVDTLAIDTHIWRRIEE